VYIFAAMKKNLIIACLLAIVCVGFVSCSPQQRAQRHIRKALRLDPTLLKPDTITFTDTIIIPEYKDSASVAIRKDTLAISHILDSVLNAYKKDTTVIYDYTLIAHLKRQLKTALLKQNLVNRYD
jgi:hypothetical protein